MCILPSTLITLEHSGKLDPEVGVLVRKKTGKDKTLIILFSQEPQTLKMALQKGMCSLWKFIGFIFMDQ